MSKHFKDHRFNDDLLAHADDLKLASERYPLIFHALDHPELRSLFHKFDAPALKSKRRGRQAGVKAVSLGCLAIAMASVDLVLPHTGADVPDSLPTWISEHLPELRLGVALVAAISGILSVVLGAFGVLVSTRKETWLANRFVTERLRQFHFQSFIKRIPEVIALAANPAIPKHYVDQRAIWFDSLKASLINKQAASYSGSVNDEEGDKLWLHDDSPHAVVVTHSEALQQLFSAYRELRFVHQISYADYKLLNDRRLFSEFPLRQAEVFSAVGIGLISLLFLIHAGVLVSVFARPFWNAFFSELASIIVLWIAVAALGIRALEAGFQPEREIERYQQYRSAVKTVLHRFDSSDQPEEKWSAMKEMERLAYEEMRSFILTSTRARFVI